MDDSMHFSDPKTLSDDGLEKYLQEINWDTLEVTTGEMRKILIENIKKYFEGKVSQDFIIGLGWVLYQYACVDDDIELLSATCSLEELKYQKVNDKRVDRSKKVIEDTFKWALKELNP